MAAQERRENLAPATSSQEHCSLYPVLLESVCTVKLRLS